MKDTNSYNAALAVLDKAIEGISALRNELGDNFIKAVDLMHGIQGRVILCGMGKSGHVARKIAATMSSTGTPALFVHPGEASHGDLGMITQKDCVILLSNSGETAELSDIIHYCKRFNIPLIAMVRRHGSLLVESADIAFVLPEISEASPVNAPTTSTTMMIVWGDVLAMALMEKNGFKADDFKIFHPGGKLGSQLLKVSQLMKKDGDLPLVHQADLMSEAIIEITSKSLGCAIVVDDNNIPIGVITDGDLRRHMSENMVSLKAADVMTQNPITIKETMFAVEALNIMNDKSITSIIVVNKSNKVIGIVHIHDILRAGIS